MRKKPQNSLILERARAELVTCAPASSSSNTHSLTHVQTHWWLHAPPSLCATATLPLVAAAAAMLSQAAHRNAVKGSGLSTKGSASLRGVLIRRTVAALSRCGKAPVPTTSVADSKCRHRTGDMLKGATLEGEGPRHCLSFALPLPLHGEGPRRCRSLHFRCRSCQRPTPLRAVLQTTQRRRSRRLAVRESSTHDVFAACP